MIWNDRRRNVTVPSVPSSPPSGRLSRSVSAAVLTANQRSAPPRLGPLWHVDADDHVAQAVIGEHDGLDDLVVVDRHATCHGQWWRQSRTTK